MYYIYSYIIWTHPPPPTLCACVHIGCSVLSDTICQAYFSKIMTGNYYIYSLNILPHTCKFYCFKDNHMISTSRHVPNDFLFCKISISTHFLKFPTTVAGVSAQIYQISIEIAAKICKCKSVQISGLDSYILLSLMYSHK